METLVQRKPKQENEDSFPTKMKEDQKVWCPVCKKTTVHKPAFFDTVYCEECKVLRILRD